MFGAAGTRRLRDRAPYAGRNNRRPYSQHPLRCPVPRSFCILQVFIAFAVIFCPLLVGRPRDHVRRGWGVPLRDHPPLCRAQHPEKGSGHVAAGYALRNILRKAVACGGRYALRNILRKAVACGGRSGCSGRFSPFLHKKFFFCGGLCRRAVFGGGTLQKRGFEEAPQGRRPRRQKRPIRFLGLGMPHAVLWEEKVF